VILLDTSVIAALMLRDPDPQVVAWLDRQPAESVWTTAITVLEVRLGLELLPAGRRQQRLQEAFTRALGEDLEDRVLPFDEAAAQVAGALAARGRRAGRPVEIRDVQIAGIAAARRATIATRNAHRFETLGVTIVDPWSVR
jgi:predicted nucleic acid-binding protein